MITDLYISASKDSRGEDDKEVRHQLHNIRIPAVHSSVISAAHPRCVHRWPSRLLHKDPAFLKSNPCCSPCSKSAPKVARLAGVCQGGWAPDSAAFAASADAQWVLTEVKKLEAAEAAARVEKVHT